MDHIISYGPLSYRAKLALWNSQGFPCGFKYSNLHFLSKCIYSIWHTVYHVILNDFSHLESEYLNEGPRNFIIVTCQIKLHQPILESHRSNQFNPWQQSQMIHNAGIILRIAVLHVLTHLGTQKYLLKCQLYQHKQVEQFDREHLPT